MSSGTREFVVNVQCAVIRHGRFLMIVRGDEGGHAPGVLAFPGGKVELEDGPSDVLERTARREVLEETGVGISGNLQYIRSETFVITGGQPAVDVLFLGDYESGEPTIADAAEVADIRWMTAEEILIHPRTPPWLRESVEKVKAAAEPKPKPR